MTSHETSWEAEKNIYGIIFLFVKITSKPRVLSLRGI